MLNERELAHVLAALRRCQGGPPRVVLEDSPHYEELEPLSDQEVDELCERINCTPEGPALRLNDDQTECPSCGHTLTLTPRDDGADFDITCDCGKELRIVCEWVPELEAHLAPTLPNLQGENECSLE